MRYAWIVTTNDTYWPSVNAMINALEYYDYPPNLDVHIIHTPEMAETLERIKNDYTFNIIPTPIGPFVQRVTPSHSVPHTLIYAKYKLAVEIAEDYNAIFHIDGDCMVLDNFMKYFEVAASTDIFVVAQFCHTHCTIDDYKNMPPEWVHSVGTPLANFPVFYNPLYYSGVMQSIWDSQPNEQTCSDPLKNTEMYFFTKALWEAGVMDRMLILPGNLWVTDAFVSHTPINEMTIASKKTLFNATGDRIQIIHNKWWKPGHAEGEIGRSPNKELCRANIDKMLGMFDFLTNLKTARE